MEIAKILRILVGTAGVVIVAALLYLLWRVYAYFYLDRAIKPPPKTPPPAMPRDVYRAPKFLYDAHTHEFYVRNE